MAVFIGVIGGLVFFKRAAGQGGISQDISAIFFSTLVLALVPFTYMCGTLLQPLWRPVPCLTPHLPSLGD